MILVLPPSVTHRFEYDSRLISDYVRPTGMTRCHSTPRYEYWGLLGKLSTHWAGRLFKLRIPTFSFRLIPAPTPCRPLTKTKMLSSLPPEILDLITGYLHDEPTTLKACCLASKLWIQRARKHLFADIKFHPLGLSVGSWKKTFPDPINSPACHTRTLSIHRPSLIEAAHVDTISTFRHVVRLNVIAGGYGGGDSLVPLHGLSPVLRSLHLTSAVLPDSELFNLVCSFPILEDLALISHDPMCLDEGWSTPSTSPHLTGSLELDAMLCGIQSTTRRLLDLPNGLRFTKITVKWFSQHDVRSTTDLVSGCSESLQTLDITSYLLGVFSSISGLNW